MKAAQFEPYLEHLRALPFARAVRLLSAGKGNNAATPTLAIRTPEREERLQIELKKASLSSALLEHWASERRTDPHILFVPAVSREMGDRLEALGLSFMDQAGNCYINLSDRYVSRVQARQAQPRSSADKGMRAPAYRALFALLVKPSLAAATVRQLAEAASVSRQAAADIRPRLESLGILFDTKTRFGWVPARTTLAIDLFVTGYSTTLRPQLLLGSFRTPARDPGELESAIETASTSSAARTDVRWGGGAAAMRMTGYYHGPKTIIHAASLDSVDLRHIKAVPDRSGPLELLLFPGPLALESLRPDTVHPLLVYAELMREQHDRAREAGQQILEKWLSSQVFE